MTRDITGQKFGKLTALHPVENGKWGEQWLCRCDCGNEKAIAKSNIIGGRQLGCGCLRGLASITHGCSRGGTRMRAYRSWESMKRRCLNPAPKDAPNYKDRGITICDRWLVFQNFLDDMGECPRGLTLERKDNNDGYRPENCVWADRLAQGRNKRSTRLVVVDGEELTSTEAAKRANCSPSAISARIRRYGETREEAVGYFMARNLAAAE